MDIKGNLLIFSGTPKNEADLGKYLLQIIDETGYIVREFSILVLKKI